MREARQHELEAHRQRTSRTYSMILVGVMFLVSGGIWLFPSSAVVSDQAAALPATADTENDAPSDPSEGVKFAQQSLNFVTPSAAPTATADVRSAATSVAEAAAEVPVAMP